MPQKSRFPLGITCHTKNQGKLKQNEKRQLVNAATKITDIWELSDEYAGIALIKMLKQAIISTDRPKKNEREREGENLNKEPKNIKEKQMEIM